MHDAAAALFRAVARGEEGISTSEALLADVAFMLTSKRQYDLPPADVAARLGLIIELPGLLLPRGRKRLYLRALDSSSARPVLGFVDAHTVATVEPSEMPLATFAAHFNGFPDIGRYTPAGPSSSTLTGQATVSGW